MKTLIQHDDTFWEFDTEQSDLILEVGYSYLSGTAHKQLYKTKNKDLYILLYPKSEEATIKTISEAIEFYYKNSNNLDKVREIFGKEIPVI